MIERHEALLACSDACAEFVRTLLRHYCERSVDLSELDRVTKRAFTTARVETIPRLELQNVDAVLLDRVDALCDGSENVTAASGKYMARLCTDLRVIEKCGARWGRLIISALNVFGSFFWPGRRQWLYERFRECCSQQENLISAFRRDYLDDAGGAG